MAADSTVQTEARPDSAHSLSAAEDRELVARAADGDERAFSELVGRHYDRALRVAHGLLKSQDDAQDVVQDAFVKVHCRLPEFRAASGFFTWLYRIVVNLSIDRMRKVRRERRVDIEDEEARESLAGESAPWIGYETGNPHHRLQRGQLRDQIRIAFESLPEIHRSVIVLREIEGLSYSEIADALDIKKGTVMSRLFHARRAMQEHLLEQERREVQRMEWGCVRAPGPRAYAPFAA